MLTCSSPRCFSAQLYLQSQESPYAALKEALLKNGYDPDVRPGGPTEPVQVEMSLNVNAIRVVSDGYPRFEIFNQHFA
jgi:hypothetical protein